MSYKRLRSSQMNEVLFAIFLKDQNKSKQFESTWKLLTKYLYIVITLLRVFTTMDTAEGYYLLFKKAFQPLERVSGRPVLFYSIHNSGFYGVILDMDTKQYSGKYLLTTC